MAGCGSKKMAKGGMVKKAKGGMMCSPRKAMAMGEKASGAKKGVQKFAMGGMVAPRPSTTGIRPRPGQPAAPLPPGRVAPQVTTIGGGPARPQTDTRKPIGTPKFVVDWIKAEMAGNQAAKTGLNMTQQQMQQASRLGSGNNALGNAMQQASLQANRVNLPGSQAVRKFKKGGSVKKGCKK